MHSSYLSKIIERKKMEVALLLKETQADLEHPLNLILKEERAPFGFFAKALKKPDLAVISEIKRRSPSCGEMNEILDPALLARRYCEGGASAISVLTDGAGFGGSLNDLKNVSSELKTNYAAVPTLRKDFVLHPLQLAEAVLAGASAVLLIVRVLGTDLKFFLNEAKRMGLETLTEVHDLEDLEIAMDAEAEIIGVNHRNLSTFSMNLDLSDQLRPLIPSSIITVAESGIHTADQAKRMRDLGYDAVLVGEALVRSVDPAELIKSMRGQ